MCIVHILMVSVANVVLLYANVTGTEIFKITVKFIPISLHLYARKVMYTQPHTPLSKLMSHTANSSVTSTVYAQA
jgi:hypothetical protein